MRKGEAREVEVEKARREDTKEEEAEEEEEEQALRAPSPMAKPTLCILSLLKSLNTTLYSMSILIRVLKDDMCAFSYTFVITGKWSKNIALINFPVNLHMISVPRAR